MLSPSILHPDLVLMRKIKRRLQAAQASPSPSPSPPAPGSPVVSGSKIEDQPTGLKREVSMVPATQLGGRSGTQIVDLED